jgi:anaerobic selenocysteine-containing dehydrogenase
MAVAYTIIKDGSHDKKWLDENTVGWPLYRERIEDFPPERVAKITGLSEDDIIRLARLYADHRPSLLKIADGINRNHNGGQSVRAICSLPAITGQYGVAGGGLSYSSSGYVRWAKETINKWQQCPQPGRWVNMNRLGAALTGEVSNPPVKSLFVFGANPASSAPNSSLIHKGLLREDLFTVVHELYMTDTAELADIVLPATSQLEQTDLHKAYGHTFLTYNEQAIQPLGESKSNWEVMTLLAGAMGFEEPWLSQTPDEIIDELLQTASRQNGAALGITLEQLKRANVVEMLDGDSIPFSTNSIGPSTGRFPTPSGRVELYSSALEDEGLDPLPGWVHKEDDGHEFAVLSQPLAQAESLNLISAATHHFVSSTFANMRRFQKLEGPPAITIHPIDAKARDISHGDIVKVENSRGWTQLKAVVSTSVRPGVVASPKGYWSKLNDGRNVNWTTSDTLADLAGQSTYQSNWVWVKPVN